MAQKSDGSLVFNTKLDNTEFKKGAQELEREAKNTTKRVNAAGKSAGEGFGSIDTSKSQKALSDLGKAADKTAGKIREASKQKIKVNDSIDSQGFEKGTSRMKAAMDGLKQRAAQFGDDLKNAVGAAFVSNAPTVKTVDQLKGMLEEMGGTVGQVFKADTITDFGKSLGDLEAQMHRFGNTKFISDDNVIFQGKDIENDFTEVQNIVKDGQAKIKKEFEKLDPAEKLNAETELTQQAVQRFGEAVQSIQNVTTPQDAGEIVEGLKAQMESYESMPWAKLDVSQDMGRIIDELTEMLAQAQDKWNETHFDVSPFEQGFQGVADKLKEIPTLTQQCVSGVSGVSNVMAGFAGKVAGLGYSIYQGLRDPLGAVNKVLGTITSAAGKAVSGLIGLAKTAGGAAVGAVKKLAVQARETAINLAKMVPNSIISGIKKLGSAIFGIGSATGKMNGGLKISFGTILRYGFGIRSLYFLFNKLRRAIIDGFNSMAAGDSQLQSNINGLKTALANLKLSFASAFAPIANIVLPYVTAMVNALATAINYIGMFISALTGKATYKKAAANMNTVSNAADNAADSAKEAKRQLAGFDKLEILSDSSKGGGGGAGGGGGGGGPTFEEVAIDSGIADWAQKLKDMFAAGDYEGIGKVIADGINAAFAKLDELIKWENVGGTITKYVDAFCRIFNSMVDNIDWDLIGKTFGDGVDTILHTINLLLTGINWDNLGKQFSEGLNGFVDAIEWDLLGETIANYFGAKMDFMSSAIENFNWGKLGTNLAKGINSFVNTISSHLDKIDWNKIGRKLAEGVNNLTKDVDTEKVGNTIGKNLTRALNGLSTFLEEVNWQEIGHKAYSFVAGINWSELTSAIYRGMGAAFGAVAGVIWGFIKDGLDNITEYFDQSIDDAGGNVALGILNGINNGFNNIVSWVKDNILKPFIDGFKKAFSIGSPAKDPDLVDAAGWVGAGILKAIADKFLDIAGWVKTNILDKIAGAIKKGKDKVGGALDFLGNGAKTVKKTVKITISKIANKAGEAWEFIKTGKETIQKTVQTVLEKVGDWAGDAWSAIKAGKETVTKTLKASFEAIGDWKSDAWAAFKSGSEDVKKAVQVTLEKVGDWSNDAWEVFKDGAETVKKTVQVTLEKAGGWAEDVWGVIKGGTEKITKTIKTIYEEATGDAPELPADGKQNLTATITLKKNGWESLTQWIGNSVKVFVGLAKNGWDSISSWVGNAVSVGIKLWHDGWSKLSDWVGHTVSVGIKLWHDGWSNIQGWIGRAVKVGVKLWRDGWSNIQSWIGRAVSVGVKLWRDGWRSISSWIGTRVSVGVELVKKGASWLWNLIHKAKGGVYSNGRWSSIPQYAKGGVVSARKYAGNIPQYAAGGSPHGTMFVAGERGPEIVGHIGGRTEVLNKSQLASTMYSAVVNGMGNIGGRIGEAICNKIAESSNAQVGALHAISSQISYSVPLMATGTVVPYSITKADLVELGHTIEASNDDLQYALVQAIAQAANLIVAAVQDIDTTTTIDQNMITRRTIEDINRRTLMFQASPLK